MYTRSRASGQEISVPDSYFLELAYKETKLDPELSLEAQGVGADATLTVLKTQGALKVP